MNAKQILDRNARALEIAKRLYVEMPGAPAVPQEDGVTYWGEVDGTAHWNFCDTIAHEILRAVAASSEGR